MGAEPKKPVTPSDLILYSTPTGAVKVGVLVRDETVWLTQKSMAELLGVGVAAINKHLKNIFESEELEEQATFSKMEIVQPEAWTQAPDGKVLKSDVAVAKNYLSEDELSQLTLATSMLLKHARVIECPCT